MCEKCDKSPVYEFTNKRNLCRTCFIRWFQKKAFYVIRKFSMISKGEVIAFKEKKDFRSVVLKEILRLFSDRYKINMKKIKGNAFRFDRLALNSTTDSEAEKILETLIKNDSEKLGESLPCFKDMIKPLYFFLDKEVLLYAKLKKLSFEKNKEKKGFFMAFLGDLEKKHPEVKRAVISSCLKLSCYP